MPKQIVYDESARRALQKGVDTVANTVKITLGPAGRNVVLEKQFGQMPMIVNDGVTIAKDIVLEDRLENAGVQLVQQVCSKTNDLAGDGTTTAAVLAQAMVTEGLRNVAAGANPMILRRGIQKATDAAVKEIKALAKSIDDKNSTQQIATVSAGNDEHIGGLIAEAMEKVGRDGVITVEESKSLETALEVVEGMQFDRGYCSPYFINDGEHFRTTMNEPYILLVDKRVNLVTELVPILEKVARAGKSLVLIAEDVDGEALATLVVNNARRIISVVAIKSPGFGERKKAIMEDIACLTGGTFICDENGVKLENVDLPMLGQAQQVRVTRDKTTIVAGNANAEKVKERIAHIKSEKEACESDFDKEKMQERIAKLAGGVAVIKVGGATETELKDRKLRLEDALNATRAAVEEGYVAGGGACLLHVSKRLAAYAPLPNADEQTGWNIVVKAFEAPVKQIADNAGLSGEVVIERIKNSTDEGFGFNAVTFEYGDMAAAGIIDPAKVERCAVQNAASIAGMMLTTEALIVELPPEKNQMMMVAAPQQF